MYAIHYYENKTYVLTLAKGNVPSVGEEVKIKGRKGKVISVLEIKENVYHVFVEFKKIVDKSKLATHDFGKRKRR
ncbi:hypothetical protein MHZ95_16740 [Sporosarcina sp. ACRSM]|uniref:hypothetical protein n=1 Tax=Sporosarcina sp. ACRSM TaxID=2918216 RepID=UPI001EF726F8|nr:hypothetical protein [Sporosarcina sp. ACRSM]MCG7336909.1 hypothetical protein [Sporosarcina sp. ACRSM]